MSSGLSDERACGRAERSSKNELVSRFPKVLQKHLTTARVSTVLASSESTARIVRKQQKKEGDTRQR